MYHIREWQYYYCIGLDASPTRRLEKLVEKRQAHETQKLSQYKCMTTSSAGGDYCGLSFVHKRLSFDIGESVVDPGLATFGRASIDTALSQGQT
jgi:hypothetical protein